MLCAGALEASPHAIIIDAQLTYSADDVELSIDSHRFRLKLIAESRVAPSCCATYVRFVIRRLSMPNRNLPERAITNLGGPA